MSYFRDGNGDCTTHGMDVRNKSMDSRGPSFRDTQIDNKHEELGMTANILPVGRRRLACSLQSRERSSSAEVSRCEFSNTCEACANDPND
jgi:hypothetical protein